MKKLTLAGWLLAMTGLMGGCGPDTPEELHEAGLEAYAEGDYGKAREYYLQAIDEETLDRDLLLDCSRAYRKDSRYDSAIYYLKRADLMYPHDREINGEIHEVAILLGDWQNAIDAIVELSQAGDGFDPYLEELTDLWLRQGEPARSFYWARRAIIHGTDNEAIYAQAANWAARADSLALAIDLLDQTIEKFGPQMEYLVNKALFLAYSGESRKAEAIIRPIVDQANPPDPGLLLNLARILGSQPEAAKKQEAIQIYREIRDVLAGAYPIDSLIQVLEDQLSVRNRY